MRALKFVLVLLLTIGLTYILSNRISIGDSKTPPLGKFLNPNVGFWKNAEGKQPHFDKEVTLSKLKKGAKVLYDDRMVPHIFAESLEDAYFLQGFVTAQHRLWQMDFQVMAAAGRISEIIGPKALNFDKKQRRMGMVFAAENELAFWKKSEGYNYAEAYTAGVNAYIDQLEDKDLPIEYKTINYRPEAWTTLKCALFLKNMAKVLASHDADLESHNALKELDRDLFDFLFPADYSTESPIVPANTKWNFDKKSLPKPQIDANQSLSYRPFEEPFEGIGSNNWAVAGSKTLSGNPILAGDPHLNLTLPSIWYEMQITTPDCNVYGVTLPGIYGVIIGFNENIAWSQTNVGRDVLDWYSIEWKDDARMEYKYGDEYKDVDIKIETFKVRDSITVYDTVRYTLHGPVAYEDGAYKDMAMRWLAHLKPEGNSLLVFPKLNKAKNYEEYKAALMDYDCPAQNFVFACKDGDIAIWAQGNYPLKSPEQGRFVLDGSNPDNDWHGFIPKEHNPHVYNPASGFVASANQKTTDASYPYYYKGKFSDYRGRFLDRKLGEMDSITVQDMMDLQQNNYSLFAEEGLPVLLANISEEKLDSDELKTLERLKKWNYTFDKESTIASLYVEWFDELYFMIWDEFRAVKEIKPVLFPEKRRTIQIMEEEPNFQYFDIAETKDTVETLKDLVTAAFKTAAIVYEGMQDGTGNYKRWADYKDSKINHLAKIKPFGVPVQVGGQRNALNANAVRGDNSTGPSWRMVVELGKEIKAYAVYPGGQSGNPGSPYYDSMVEDWATAEYYPLLFMKKPKENHPKVIFTQRFSKN